MISELVELKRCCTICDAKKKCHACGESNTLWACADCQINLSATVYVCPTRKCREFHETKCSANAFDAGRRAGLKEAAEIAKDYGNDLVAYSVDADRVIAIRKAIAAAILARTNQT